MEQLIWLFDRPDEPYHTNQLFIANETQTVYQTRAASPKPPASTANDLTLGHLYNDSTEQSTATPEMFSKEGQTWKRQHLSGWRAGALTSCLAALIVLIVNFIITLWVTISYPMVDHVGVLFHGNCAKAKSINAWSQVAVNILSTVLLGASNYCMQCLSSPTREEVDRAHSKRLSMHIGVLSVHNMSRVILSRKILWLSLGLSALPLHFV